MHLIKKYANRKLYDTTEKQYITMDGLAALIKSGQEIRIIDNETDEDLTTQIVSQLLGREKPVGDKALPSSVLMQMLRKGRGTLFGYGKKYVSLWQSALLMSREEFDRLVNRLVNESEISETEGNNLKSEIAGFTTLLRRWMKENVDQYVNEVLDRMHLSTKDQVIDLTRKVDTLDAKVEALEQLLQECRTESDQESERR